MCLSSTSQLFIDELQLEEVTSTLNLNKIEKTEKLKNCVKVFQGESSIKFKESALRRRYLKSQYFDIS